MLTLSEGLEATYPVTTMNLYVPCMPEAAETLYIPYVHVTIPGFYKASTPINRFNVVDEQNLAQVIFLGCKVG